jgi:hypothetical protein
LSYSPSVFAFSLFSHIGSSANLQGLTSNHDPPTSTYQVIRSTSMCPHSQLTYILFKNIHTPTEYRL